MHKKEVGAGSYQPRGVISKLSKSKKICFVIADTLLSAINHGVHDLTANIKVIINKNKFF